MFELRGLLLRAKGGAHCGVTGVAGLAGALAGLAASGHFRRCSAEELQPSFSRSEFRSFPVQEVRAAGPGTRVLRCKLPSDGHKMGMQVSSMVMVNGEKSADGKTPARPYTPITTDEQAGYFELLVKGYPNGVVSKYL